MQLEYGPLNKTLHTQALEVVAKTLIHQPQSARVSIVNNQVMAQIDGQTFNVSALLQKANLSHFELSNHDSDVFMKHANELHCPAKYSNLSTAERTAIKSYTGSSYHDMNNMMYGHPNKIYSNLNDTLVKTLMVCSGLNKIPSECSQAYTYRGEHSTPDADIQKRIDGTEMGGNITQEIALKSTSDNYNVAQNFSGNVFIHFNGTYGKDVSGLSYFAGESEFLLMPNKILWTEHYTVGNKHYFEAEVVEPLDHARDSVTEAEQESYYKLFDFAQKHGMNLDFVTPHNKSQLENKDSALELNDDSSTDYESTEVDVLSNISDLTLRLADLLIDDNPLADVLTKSSEIFNFVVDQIAEPCAAPIDLTAAPQPELSFEHPMMGF